MTKTELRFSPNSDGAFTFDTGVIKGTLRRKGTSVGLVPVVHIETGIELADGAGLFNHYRVFTLGKRYGQGARNWPSTARLADDGGVEIVWEVTDERPFELCGSYNWVTPNTIDLVTTVRAKNRLEAFEVFLASYYRPQFIDSRVWASPSIKGETTESFAEALEEYGVWQAFPRDNDSAAIIKDGRWDLEPHPLEWNMRPTYARPLAVRRDPVSKLTLVSLAQRDECFGVFTPYGEENHYSNYFSLFGRDIKPGATARTRTRLVIMNDPTDEEILAQADAFLQVL